MKIIVDLEATCCDQGSIPRHEMEIIEIGAVAYDEQAHETIDEISILVKPVVHPELTGFCKSLTSISQRMVDRGVGFVEAAEGLSDFIASYECNGFSSWGDYDKHQLRQDCGRHGVEWAFGDEHENIKKMFASNMNLRKPCGLGAALRKVDIDFVGTAHRGIDDARNMARLGPYIWL